MEETETGEKLRMSKVFEVIVQIRVSVLPLISKYNKQVENTRRSRVFLTSLSVFRNQKKNTYEC
jgi:hypothetical protein